VKNQLDKKNLKFLGFLPAKFKFRNLTDEFPTKIPQNVVIRIGWVKKLQISNFICRADSSHSILLKYY